jgi:hypothetical protein
MPAPARRPPRLLLGLNAVVIAVTDEVPRLLTVRPEEAAPVPRGARGQPGRPLPALPFGPLDPVGDRTLDLGLRKLVREQTGLELGYVEQLYTFADRDRVQPGPDGDTREISVAYLALVREGRTDPHLRAQWRDWYDFFPWEDWRSGRPAAIDAAIVPALKQWAEAASDLAQRQARRERVDITFGMAGAPWDRVRVLERYELLYEAGLVHEATRDARATTRARGAATAPPAGLGAPMLLDHRRILATALSRLRGKLQYRPVVFELLPSSFTLLQLQRLVEALAGVRLHKQNFRRLVERGGLVEGTGEVADHTSGRPAELFRFRREVLRERRAPGVWQPGTGVTG